MKTNLMKSVLMFMALVAVVFTSCSKGGDSPDNNPAPVRFTSAIASPAPITKATGTAWANGDNVGIFMVNAGSTTIAENADNRLYTTDGTSAFTTDEPIYYPVNGSNVDFIAYYPYVASQLLSATYPVNVATQTSQAAIDLLWSNNAKVKSKGATAVGLTFDHKLSKVIIIATPTDGLTVSDLTAMTVKIKGMNTAADFDLKTGMLGTPGTTADITAFVATAGSKYEAIVLPASFATGALTMDFELNNSPKNEVFVRKNTVIEAFEPGKVYTYNVNVKRTEVEVTCTITNWDTTPAAREGDAE